MVIFNKYNDKGQVVVQVGLEMLYKSQGHFAFPVSVDWIILDSIDVSRKKDYCIETKKCDKYYSFTISFLCFFVDLQVDVYGKR